MLIQGDALTEIMKLPNESIDLIIIDPPYITLNENWDKTEVVTLQLIRELFRIAKESCSLYVWCGIGEKSQSLIRWFPIFSNLWYFKDLISWKKQRGIGMRRGWLYAREEIMWFVKNNKEFIWNNDASYSLELTNRKDLGFNGKPRKSLYKRISNIWTDITEVCQLRKEAVNHPAQKPLKAIERIIKAHTKERDTILDCFAGSGTTLVAAKSLNRNFVGIEISSEYCKIAEERLANV